MNIALFVWRECRSCSRWLVAATAVFLVHGAAMYPFPGLYLLLMAMFPAFLALGPLLVEAKYPTDRLWASLPVRRWELVAARYVAAFLGLGLGLAAAVAWTVPLAAVMPARWPAPPTLLAGAMATALAFLLTWMVSLYLPFVFRFGPAKGPLVFAASFMALAAAAGAVQHQAAQWTDTAGPSWILSVLRSPGQSLRNVLSAAGELWGAPVLLALLAGLTVAVAALSLALSIRFYARRDL